ncbi:hypothetical protein KDA_42300 [Dictyobacter alpinus]|uniref:Anaphase-promoting complex subunit 4-like WD40 domain-containing protein n=1 Tax=Dictyobacter alpinus TaxID=2014873 RepID=A0A402BBQ2_9CHLR|nr:WD40 repeat domain-containing protein [Dictyobacter alpinus]GCE28746.1 hypothetical protein KDA_42300 [Dictyobacter alpinus]
MPGQQQQEQPMPSSSPPISAQNSGPGRRKFSRRNVLFGGLATLGGAYIAGSGLWWATRPRSLYIYRGYTVFTPGLQQTADGVNALAWSADGKRIASGRSNEVRVWDAANGTLAYTHWAKPVEYMRAGSVKSVIWSPNGKYLASSTTNERVQVWNAANGADIHTYRPDSWGLNEHVVPITWAPDSQFIASGYWDYLDGLTPSVRVWNALTGQSPLMYSGHTQALSAVAWSPDGKLIASGSEDHTIQVWDPISGDLFFKTDVDSSTIDVLWSADSKRIAYFHGSGPGLRIQDIATGKIVQSLQADRFHTIDTLVKPVWSLDGKYIAVAARTSMFDLPVVYVWDATTGAHIYSYSGHQTRLNAIAWSPDSKRIASSDLDRLVHVWEINA